MRKYILRLLLSQFFLLLFVGSVQGQWKKITTIPAAYSGNYWLDVFFLPSNPNYGWVCGFNGMVIRTTDGGTTWQGSQAPSPAYHLESVHFLSTTVGYTSGTDGIFKSTDGGASWTNVSPTGTVVTWGCYFTDTQNGYFLGGGCGLNQVFYKTTNGGSSWTFYTDSIPNSGLSDVMMYANGTGYVSGSGKIWRSTNYGVTWQVYATTGSSLWQEEITNIGQSFLVPIAGETCAGAGLGGGMRFSTNDGLSWNSFDSGQPMFGTFLNSATNGWACGDGRAVYFTSNSGATWQLRNCGIDQDADLDDIFFINDSLGFVVGDGVYKYVGEERSLSKSVMNFGEVCIPDVKKDTLWLRNKSWNGVSAPPYLSGVNAGQFTILQPTTNFGINACDSLPYIIQFHPTTTGTLTALVSFLFPNGSTTSCTLTGIGRGKTAFAVDTLVSVNPAYCGWTTTGNILWQNPGLLESISEIQKVTGSSLISCLQSPPVNVGASGSTLNFAIMPADTGWVSGRFRVRLSPCVRDTFITARFYGVSPIINSWGQNNFGLGCLSERTDAIPVSNTGNANLVIASATLSGANVGDFSVIGWKSGASFPRIIPQGGADSLLIRFKPLSGGAKSAVCTLVNNDSTSVRGRKNPFPIDLTGSQSKAVFSLSRSTMDFADVCVGKNTELLLEIFGDKTADGIVKSFSFVKNNGFSIPAPVPPITVKAGNSAVLRVLFTPTVSGTFVDTLKITISPCDTVLRVAVRVNVGAAFSFPRANSIELNPVPVGKFALLSTDIFNPSDAPEQLDSIRFLSGSPLFSAIISGSFPVPLVEKTDFPVSFGITPPDTGWYDAQFRAYFSPCKKDTVISVRVYAVSPIIQSVAAKDFHLASCETTKIDTVWIDNTGNAELSVTNFVISGANAGDFRLLIPQSAVLKIAPKAKAPVPVEFIPTQPGVRVARLSCTHNENRPAFPVPNPWNIDLSGDRGYPIIAVNSSKISFGDVCVGASKDLILRFDNSGNAPAQIMTVTSSNANITIVPVLGSFPVSVNPNNFAEFLLRFTPTAQGLMQERVIFSLEPCSERIAVDIAGNGIETVISASPAQIQTTIQTGSVTTLSVQLLSAGNAPAVISSLSLTPPRTDWRLLGIPSLPITLQPGQNLRLTVEFSPQSDTTFSGIISCVASGQCPTTTGVVISAQSTKSRLVLSQESVFFGKRPCESVELLDSVIIYNRGSAAFSVTNISLQSGIYFHINSTFTFPFEISAASSATIYLASLRGQAGIFRDTLQILTTDEVKEKRVPLEVNVFIPKISANTGAMNFGRVLVGGTKSADFVIQSDAERILKAVLIEPTSANLTVSAPSIIPVGQTVIPVSFLSPEEGAYSYFIRFVLGGACSDTLTLSVNATTPVPLTLSAKRHDVIAGDTFHIPLTLSGRLGRAKPSNVRIAVRIAPLLAQPVKAMAGDSTSGIFVPYSFDYRTGLTIVTLDSAALAGIDTVLKAGGTLLTLRCLPFGTKPDTSTIFLPHEATSIQSVAETILTLNDGFIDAERFCRLASTLLEEIPTFAFRSVSPHPSGETVRFSIDCSSAQTLSLRITNSLGILVLTKNIAVGEGLQTIEIDAANMPEGAYFMELVGSVQRLVVPLMKCR